MKVSSELKNCDKFFLRRMLGWIAKEIEVPCKSIRMADYKYIKGVYRGRHKASGHIIIGVNDETEYPYHSKDLTYADEIELLVWLSGWMVKGLAHRADNAQCRSASRWCLKKFREKRSDLIFDWCKPEVVREKKKPVPLLEKRKVKVEKALAEWERKFKLAETKVAKYKKKLAYYEKKLSD